MCPIESAVTMHVTFSKTYLFSPSYENEFVGMNAMPSNDVSTHITTSYSIKNLSHSITQGCDICLSSADAVEKTICCVCKPEVGSFPCLQHIKAETHRSILAELLETRCVSGADAWVHLQFPAAANASIDHPHWLSSNGTWRTYGTGQNVKSKSDLHI